MAFDGGFLYKTIEELKEAVDCHVDKIYQPSRDELVFSLRKKGFVKKLLITVKSGSTRIHFTENKYENPPSPPMFCMLIRKYLSSARLIDIRQPSLERVAELVFSSTNEMGDRVNISLVCELIGNMGNIILVNSDGKIIDSLKHSDVETAARLILPGATYELPTSQNKLNPLSCNITDLCKNIKFENSEISKQLLSLLDGFSPLVCREIEHIYNLNLKTYETRESALENALKTVVSNLTNLPCLTMIFKEDGSAFDFSYIDINQYGNYEKKVFTSCSELLDAFYTSRDNIARIKSAAHDMIRHINNLISRTQKKLAIRLEELHKCKDREKYRIFGELLKANLYSIENGSSKVSVPNYYDENMALIDIPLNPALSPAKNAEKYFKEYKKSYAAEQALSELTEIDKRELLYFESVIDSISRSSTLSEIDEIRDELVNGGYIKRYQQKQKTKPKLNFNEYTSCEGYRILVGKNNTQNDYITTKLASKQDLWFHTKNIPGSHVIVFSNGENVSDETIIFAAELAAYNSKASTSANVPVDYTNVKYVKKPSGAKPGMVIYTTNKTIFVDPKNH